MAFQGSLRNGAAASLDMLPLLSSTAPMPWQALGRSQLRHASRSAFPTPSAPGFSTRSMALATAGPVSRKWMSSGSSVRAFSSNSLFESFRLATPRTQLSRPTQVRMLNNGTTSHNALAHLESTANNNSTSASAQNAFYSALIRANMPEILVERYETGRYATNAACDAMYYRALDRLGQANNASAGGTAGSASAGRQQGLSQDQMAAVARAVGANVRGGNTATARDTGSGETGARGSPVHVIVEESMGMTVWKIARFLIVFGAVGYLAMVLVTFAIEASGVLRRVGGGTSTEVKPEEQKARFDDVKGCDDAKEELREVVDFLRSPDKYNQLGGKLPKGVLMVGPPGTGKTLLARAVAGEAGVPFFYMSGSEFDEVYVGVGAKRVRELFQNAKSKAPAIVFIDELDAVGGKRNERDAAYHMQTLNQMLTELDGFDQTSGVVFIAATNFPQMLDKALTRPGRFDRTIHVELPDVRGRVDILKYYMRDMQVATEVDASLVARGTPGFSGADLENLVNQAAVHASKNAQKKVSMRDLEWAKDKVLMGAEKRSMIVPEAEKLMTAYHEAGHALVGIYTRGCDPMYKVTIMPRGGALGVTFFLPEMDEHSRTKQQYSAQIDMALGGKVAEELIYGVDSVTSGCSSDLSNATSIAYNMVMRYGMSEKLGPVAYDGALYEMLGPESKAAIESEVRRFISDGEDRARLLLSDKRRELELLAKALLQYETLNLEEVSKVIKGESLPEKMSSLASSPMKIPQIPLPTFPGSDGKGGSGGPPIPETASP